MALQLNAELTKALAINFSRLGTTQCRLIFVKDSVLFYPSDTTTTQMDAYFQSFMLTGAAADNYLGSVVITGYQNFNNTIVFGTGTGTALKSGTVGSVICVHSSSTAAPVASTTASGYVNARYRCMFIHNSLSTVEDPKTTVMDSLTFTQGQVFTHLSTTISMVSAS